MDHHACRGGEGRGEGSHFDPNMEPDSPNYVTLSLNASISLKAEENKDESPVCLQSTRLTFPQTHQTTDRMATLPPSAPSPGRLFSNGTIQINKVQTQPITKPGLEYSLRWVIIKPGGRIEALKFLFTLKFQAEHREH